MRRREFIALFCASTSAMKKLLMTAAIVLALSPARSEPEEALRQLIGPPTKVSKLLTMCRPPVGSQSTMLCDLQLKMMRWGANMTREECVPESVTPTELWRIIIPNLRDRVANDPSIADKSAHELVVALMIDHWCRRD